jgi:nickel superoxide dismutase
MYAAMPEERPLLGRTHRLLDRFRAPTPARAHCDIPCGIYDPHEAQLAALTVVRMDQLINELQPPAADAKPDARAKYHSQFARYVRVKEAHADKCESELTTILNDYFTAEHRKKYADLDERYFKAIQAISKARQGTITAEAEDALKQVQGLAEVFWETKGAKTARVPSHSKAGGELVVPVT